MHWKGDRIKLVWSQKLMSAARMPVLFFFFLVCFSLFKMTEICFGSTKMGIFYQEKAFHAGIRKIRKKLICPLRKIFLLRPWAHYWVWMNACLLLLLFHDIHFMFSVLRWASPSGTNRCSQEKCQAKTLCHWWNWLIPQWYLCLLPQMLSC